MIENRTQSEIHAKFSCSQCNTIGTRDCSPITHRCYCHKPRYDGRYCARCASSFDYMDGRGECHGCPCNLLWSDGTCKPVFLHGKRQVNCQSCRVGHTGLLCDVCETDLGYELNPALEYCTFKQYTNTGTPLLSSAITSSPHPNNTSSTSSVVVSSAMLPWWSISLISVLALLTLSALIYMLYYAYGKRNSIKHVCTRQPARAGMMQSPTASSQSSDGSPNSIHRMFSITDQEPAASSSYTIPLTHTRRPSSKYYHLTDQTDEFEFEPITNAH